MTEQIDKAKLLERIEHEEYLAKLLPKGRYSEGILFLADVLRIAIESGTLDSSSEQAAREEAARLQKQLKGIGIEEYYALQAKHRSQLMEIGRLEGQLNQAVELIRGALALPSRGRNWAIDARGMLRQGLSSLSQEGESP